MRTINEFLEEDQEMINDLYDYLVQGFQFKEIDIFIINKGYYVPQDQYIAMNKVLNIMMDIDIGNRMREVPKELKIINVFLQEDQKIIREVYGHITGGVDYEDCIEYINGEGYYIPKDQYEAMSELAFISQELIEGSRKNEYHK